MPAGIAGVGCTPLIPAPLFGVFVLIGFVIQFSCRGGLLDARPERMRLLSELTLQHQEIALDEFCYGTTRLRRARSFSHKRATLTASSGSGCGVAPAKPVACIEVEPSGRVGVSRQYPRKGTRV